MKVGIFINTTKTEANKAANKFSKMLIENNIDYKVVNLKSDCKDVDVIAVFGGDGTILSVVESAIEYDVPIFAVNEGTLGFLSSIESNELQNAVQIIKDTSNIQKRSVIKVITNDKTYYALNEAIVQRIITGNFMCGIARLNLDINNQFVDSYNVDGIIISTPTGSTAYSLSAGGAILTPDLPALIVTPICPHSLHNRPIVYPDSYQATIKVLENSTKVGLFIDGKFIKEIKGGDKIEIVKSRRMVKFYKSNEQFFEKLLKKLNKWSETK